MSASPPRQPISPAAERFADVVALCNRVFRPDGSADMSVQYPLVLDPDRLDQVRILEGDSGRPVSMVCMVMQEALYPGGAVRVPMVGLVCTGQEAQGHGLAGRLMDDAIDRATALGCPLMLISGGRTLYTRRGSHYAGDFVRYELTAAKLDADPGLEVVELTPELADEAWPLLEREPLRWRRTAVDYARLLAPRWVVGYNGSSWLVRRDGRAVAIFSINRDKGVAANAALRQGVREIAGARPAILAALAALAPQMGTVTWEIDAYPWDTALREACAAAGASSVPSAHYGTIRILSLDRLREAYLPLLRERVGPAADRLEITGRTDDGIYRAATFELDGERHTIVGERELLAALFGSPELDPIESVAEPLRGKLRQAFPLPLPMYGLNYV